jgi:hypothetical protein
MNTKLLSVIGYAILAAPLATAAISVVDSGGIAKTQSAAPSITVTAAELGDFDADGSSKLVVTVSGERGGSGSYEVAGITYGGQAMTLIQQNQTDNAARQMSIWYLDNVSVTGDFVVSFDGNGSGIGLGVVALTGTASGYASSNFSLGTSTSITTTVPSQFVMAAGMNNGSTAPTAVSPLTQLFSGDTGSSVGAAGYQFAASAGTVTPTFTGANGVIAASFLPVPEPRAALLGSLGILALLRRRR